jgi:tetratricopeptide (TPR) repeat protein
MGKDLKARLEKAHQLFKAMQFKKSGKIFTSVGETYQNLKDYDAAKECFFNAAQSYLEDKKYFSLIKSLRSAGGASIMNNNFTEANEFYKQALDYISSLKKQIDRNEFFILFSCLSFLTTLNNGDIEDGLNLIKKIRIHVDDKYFLENDLIKLVKNFTIAVKEHKLDYIRRIEQNFDKLTLTDLEKKLVKKTLVLVNTHNLFSTKLALDKEIYTTNELITADLEIDTTPLLEINQSPFYDYQIKQLKITKMGIDLSDNFTSQERPTLPILLNLGQKNKYQFKIKPHFQMEKPFIGPVSLTADIDGILIFYHKTYEILKPHLISPPPTLEFSLKNLRTPLIGQTFPLEILIENKSEGEAINLNIEVEFPEQLKVMRGTLKKQIYSLKPNENLRWEININPSEAGDYLIKINTEFNDPDQNKIEDVKEFPFSIKL